MKKLWPFPLWLELAVAVLIALMITNLATGLFFRMAWHSNSDAKSHHDSAEQAVRVIGALVDLKPDAQIKLVAALSHLGQVVSMDAAPLIVSAATRNSELEALVKAAEPSLMARDVRVSTVSTRPPRVQLAVRFPQHTPRVRRPWAAVDVSVSNGPGRWINGTFNTPATFDLVYPILFSGIIGVFVLIGASYWMARRVVRPLHALEAAARSLGPGDPPAPVVERGPRAVRAVIGAFNTMSKRLLTALDNQRVIMAAVAHDLRSPITSLRLRTEFITDADTKERMLETLAEMQTMTEAVIDLARAGKSSEHARLVDLNALVESLCVDFADTGASVTFIGGPVLRANLRVSEVTRALRNLIENAMRYGKSAAISIERTPGEALVHIYDEGPGIPPDQIDAVFEPFARLEGSRSLETGGHGLGLTISRMIARGHGGDVVLANRAVHGLRATLRLPREA